MRKHNTEDQDRNDSFQSQEPVLVEVENDEYQKADKGEYDRPEYVFSIGATAVRYRRKMLEDIKE